MNMDFSDKSFDNEINSFVDMLNKYIDNCNSLMIIENNNYDKEKEDILINVPSISDYDNFLTVKQIRALINNLNKTIEDRSKKIKDDHDKKINDINLRKIHYEHMISTIRNLKQAKHY